MMNAVGIDVSKGKSTVTVLQPGGVFIHKPYDVSHKSSDLRRFTQYIGSLEGDTKAVLECTGRYHEPILHALSDAGIFVSAVNPHLIKNYGNNSLRPILPTPRKSPDILLTTGPNFVSIRAWTILVLS